MVGNIWLASAITVTVIFSASVTYKAYQDIQDARNIQQSFEIISEIKSIVAKQYNKNPEDVTRDEIIAYLPKGENWDRVLLVNRNNGSDLANNFLVDEDGNFILDEDERVKLLALNAKLKEYGIEDSSTTNNQKVTFTIGSEKKNFAYKDNIIKKSVKRTIEILYINRNSIDTKFDDIITNNIPYVSIYQNMIKDSDTDPIDEDELKKRQEAYFKNRIKDSLISSKNSRDTNLYNLIKDKL